MFKQSITSRLTLTIGEEEFVVEGGNIKYCKLDLKIDGFNGEVGFFTSNEVKEDKLINSIVSPSLIKIELTLAQETFSKAETAEKITLNALVSERSLEEKQYIDVEGNKVLYRYYVCQFMDPAQFVWLQHFPTSLYVKKSVEQAIKEQVTDLISLNIDWPEAESELPFVCLGLGALQISFYQFLLWYIQQNGAYLIYDYEKNEYKISNSKSEPKTEVMLAPTQIESAKVLLAKPTIQSTNLLNGDVNLASTDSLYQCNDVSGVNFDRLTIDSIKQDAEHSKNKENRFLKPRNLELCLKLKEWPLQALEPGCKLTLKNPDWNADMLSTNQSFRLYSSSIELYSLTPSPMEDLHQKHSSYECTIAHKAEELTDVHRERAPNLIKPILVQGEIVSEPGEEQDKTFQYKQDENTKQLFYRVKIPVWDDQEILIRYKPDFMPPHFYFPLYKGTQVELEILLFEARITRVLDWGARVFLDQHNQGNHLIFGKNEQDETRLKYDYQDDKPVLSLERIKDKDTELVQLEEGKIIFRTQEQD